MWQRVASTAAALALGFALGRAARRWRRSPIKPDDEDPLSIVSDSARVIAGTDGTACRRVVWIMARIARMPGVSIGRPASSLTTHTRK